MTMMTMMTMTYHGNKYGEIQGTEELKQGGMGS